MDSGAPRGLLGCLVSTHCMRSPLGRQGSRHQRLRYSPGTPPLARSGAAPAVRTPDQHQGWQARSREASCPSHWRTQHACSGPLPLGTGTVSAKERAGGVAEQEPRARDLWGPRTTGCLPRVGGGVGRGGSGSSSTRPRPGSHSDTWLLGLVLLVQAALTPRTQNRQLGQRVPSPAPFRASREASHFARCSGQGYSLTAADTWGPPPPGCLPTRRFCRKQPPKHSQGCDCRWWPGPGAGPAIWGPGSLPGPCYPPSTATMPARTCTGLVWSQVAAARVPAAPGWPGRAALTWPAGMSRDVPSAPDAQGSSTGGPRVRDHPPPDSVPRAPHPVSRRSSSRDRRQGGLHSPASWTWT